MGKGFNGLDTNDPDYWKKVSGLYGNTDLGYKRGGERQKPTVLTFRNSKKLILSSAPGKPYFSVDSVNKALTQFPNDCTIVCLLDKGDIKSLYYKVPLFNLYKEKLNAEVIWFPIRDYDVPNSFIEFKKLIETIVDRLKSKDVIIHCNAGHGRTGLVAAAVLMLGGKLDAKTAIDKIRKARPGTVETDEQEIYLDIYGETLKSN
jgi:hypothetical protein